MTINPAIDYALRLLNHLYGRGELLHFDTTTGKATRKPYGCKPETFRFRVVDGTIYACGHQRKLLDWGCRV